MNRTTSSEQEIKAATESATNLFVDAYTGIEGVPRSLDHELKEKETVCISDN